MRERETETGRGTESEKVRETQRQRGRGTESEKMTRRQRTERQRKGYYSLQCLGGC